MLIFSRELIIYFKKSAKRCAFKDLDVIGIVVNGLYKKLMDDVKKICEDHLDELYDVIYIKLAIIICNI